MAPKRQACGRQLDGCVRPGSHGDAELGADLGGGDIPDLQLGLSCPDRQGAFPEAIACMSAKEQKCN